MTSSGLPHLPCYRQSPVRCLRPPTIQVNLVVWGDDLVLQWIHAHASVYGGVDFTRFFPRQGGPRIPRSMPSAVHTWNSEHYFYGPVYLVFICFYSRWPSRVCRLARLCAHSGQFFDYGPFVSTEGTNGLRYSRDFAYQVIARELALALTYIKVPGPSATEERWLTRGDWRSSWFAESQVCSAHSVPLLIMFPFFLSFNN